MPDDNNQNQRGGGRGNRGQGGGGEKKDSFFEVATGRVFEEITRLAGRPIGTFISQKVLDGAKGYAHSGQLELAFRFLGPFMEAAFGDDEEVRGAIRGTFEGLTQGAKGATNDNAISKVEESLQNSAHFSRLQEFARQGRLEAARIIPFEEAFLKLSEPQQVVIEKLVSRLNDNGEHLKAKFSAVGLQGVAKMLIVAKWSPAPLDPSAPPVVDPMVERFRVRFSLAKTKVEETFTGALGIVKAIEKQINEEVKKGNATGLPFEAELQARAGGIAAGSNAMERARLRARSKKSLAAPGTSTQPTRLKKFIAKLGSIKAWLSSLGK